jgi:PEP-CTERM motif
MTCSKRLMMATTLLVLSLVAPARAGFIVNLTESGGNVVATGSGTINTTALVLESGGGNFLPVLVPNIGEALFGAPHSDIYLYGTAVGPTSFGSIGGHLADSGTGDFVGIDPFSLSPIQDYLAVPENYVSGSMLQSSDTWSGQTFASLGLTPGTYTWTWGTGANADFFTMNIGVSSVPEPSSLLLSACGLGIVACAAWARRRPRISRI